jgi:hypothetical protein
MMIMLDLPEYPIPAGTYPGDVVDTPEGPAYLFDHGISAETVGQPFLFSRSLLIDERNNILDSRCAPKRLTGVRGAAWIGRGLIGRAVPTP